MQFMFDPESTHCLTVKQILCYLCSIVGTNSPMDLVPTLGSLPIVIPTTQMILTHENQYLAMCLFSMVVTLSGPLCHLVCSLQTVQSHIGIHLLCLKPKVASCICYPLGLTLGVRSRAWHKQSLGFCREMFSVEGVHRHHRSSRQEKEQRTLFISLEYIISRVVLIYYVL